MKINKMKSRLSLIILFLSLFLTTTFSYVYLIQLRKWKPITYAIHMDPNIQSNFTNTLRLVNWVLFFNIDVYWLAETLNLKSDGGNLSLTIGDFLIPFHSDIVNFQFSYYTSFPHQYFQELCKQLNVSVAQIRSDFETLAYRLNQARIGVFYGGGVTGGSLEHIQPLEKAGFTLGIFREDNLSRAEIDEYNMITFPGGGPYSNYLNQSHLDEIKNYLANKGGFMGTCGGMALGVELELLNVDLAMVGEYEAYEDLRGPVMLNLTSSTIPIVYGCNELVECMYFMGPFVYSFGDDVEIIASYHSSTVNLSIYAPEIIQAYNFTSTTTSINNFWGTPAILKGNYHNGNIILSTVHPEVLPNSQKIFFNSIFELCSQGIHHFETTEDYTRMYLSSRNDFTYQNIGNNSTSLLYEVLNMLSTLRENASYALSIFEGLELVNYQIVGVSGEYLKMFIEDIESRSSRLVQNLNQLAEYNEKFENTTEFLMKKYSYGTFQSIIQDELLSEVRRLKEAFYSLENSIKNSDELLSIMSIIIDELAYERDLLNQILNMNMSQPERAQKIVALHTNETLTLSKLKDELDYYLLMWSFQLRDLLIESHFINYMLDMYINSGF